MHTLQGYCRWMLFIQLSTLHNAQTESEFHVHHKWLISMCLISHWVQEQQTPQCQLSCLQIWRSYFAVDGDTVNLPVYKMYSIGTGSQNVGYKILTFDKFGWMCDATVQRGQCYTNCVLKNAVLKRRCALCLTLYILSLWNSCAVHEALRSESTGICQLMTVAVYLSVVTAVNCYLKTCNS